MRYLILAVVLLAAVWLVPKANAEECSYGWRHRCARPTMRRERVRVPRPRVVKPVVKSRRSRGVRRHGNGFDLLSSRGRRRAARLNYKRDTVVVIDRIRAAQLRYKCRRQRIC